MLKQLKHPGWDIKIKIVENNDILLNVRSEKNINEDHYLHGDEKGISLCVDQIRNYLEVKLLGYIIRRINNDKKTNDKQRQQSEINSS